ncbi:MAG: nitroreductase family protein [Armatimonadota bacterium]|jgi:nitroreductase
MLEAIKNRRSVRFYRDTPVSDEQIEELLKAGFCAPSGHAANAWHVIVIRDQQIKDKLATLHRWSKILARAPVIIVVCVDREKQDLWIEDGSAFMQNVLIQATEMGLGTCWVMMREEDEGGLVHQTLDLPANIAPVASAMVGYGARYPGPHDPVLPQDRIHKDRFGQ